LFVAEPAATSEPAGRGLKLTFVGVPESVPEENEADKSTGINS
jgi:hypothetical protein